ncbi:winged helix-turn-helix transcriptional regulator [Falsiruegeria litorea]|uniref:winged helix-turn-helix transcriptional regulator n=1 Tax=Falsiruegeria litorea TaxID=1280831 RepID=UPI00203DDE17|nr:helix-turn-helix domain-containing protein [Falsiruegeria litorea]
MATPFPGQLVRGSKTAKPIMALLDLLGRTWTLGIIWQLNQGPATFRELQSRCEQISPSLLNTRLKELKTLNLVTLSSAGYQLSAQGEHLFSIISPLGQWAGEWADELQVTQDKENS